MNPEFEERAGAYKPEAILGFPMNAAELRDEIESEYETELSRLGSSKSMYAATEGEMEGDAVLSAMADRAHAAAETFDTWTAETTDTVLADVYGSMAADQHAAADRIVDAGEGTARERPTRLEAYLRDLESPAERAGGLLAWALVTDRTLSQAVGFFVGNADPTTADLFRELRSEVEEETGRIEALLEESCADADDWEDALAAASASIEAAYEDYVETLESLGVNVKPVC